MNEKKYPNDEDDIDLDIVEGEFQSVVVSCKCCNSEYRKGFKTFNYIFDAKREAIDKIRHTSDCDFISHEDVLANLKLMEYNDKMAMKRMMKEMNEESENRAKGDA